MEFGRRRADQEMSMPPLEYMTWSGATGPECALCNRPAAGICSGCRSSRYCSVDCSQQDWQTHKLLCRTFKDFLVPPLGTNRDVPFRRVLLFPAAEKAPRFVWIQCEATATGCEGFNAAADLLGDERPMPAVEWVDKSLQRRKEIENSIEIIFADDFAISGARPNQSILSATQGHTPTHWCGNVVAMKYDGNRNHQTSTVNMTTEDFQHAVDFFLTYGTEGKRTSSRPDNEIYMLGRDNLKISLVKHSSSWKVYYH